MTIWRHNRRPRITLALLVACGLALQAFPQGEPPARGLALDLTGTARLAGTSGSAWGARHLSRVLRAAGWEVEIESREVLLSLPRRLELAAFGDGETDAPFLTRIDRFDPDAIPPGDVPPFNAWSASGEVRARLVDVGRGLRGDYERLQQAGVDVRGCIALARYGGSYRGVKLDLATGFGCVGLLLFSDPAENHGASWPAGPFKPSWAVQRGSVSPMGRSPGDPSTPGFASPLCAARPGGTTQSMVSSGEQADEAAWCGEGPADSGPSSRARLSPREVDRVLPTLPCLPVGWGTALELKEQLENGVGPGPAQVFLSIDQPRDLRVIHNVIARLPGSAPGGKAASGVILAGNHRDAWVRGAQDAGSGTVSLLRAAQRLGERYASGWRPARTIQMCFWDGEESGLIGSTEWAEGHADWVRENALVYINCDAVVSGFEFNASGSPGLLGSLRTSLEAVQQPDGDNLWDRWSRDGEPELGLPGSGSDFAVFLHHLSVPVLDIHFGGNQGGQYHTLFDDFTQMDRHLDPGWVGHELAGLFLATLLADYAERGAGLFDEAEAAADMAERARGCGQWLGEEQALELASAFDGLAQAARGGGPPPPVPGRAAAPFLAELALEAGLAGRPWFVNRLWTPGLETGYSAETFPSLRNAVRRDTVAAELADLIEALERRRAAWLPQTP
ncbi:MAG: M28 family peptidase [Planctomycetota bacterium]|nr:M28 family peptidase [Planctomycetota bacterium]